MKYKTSREEINNVRVIGVEVKPAHLLLITMVMVIIITVLMVIMEMVLVFLVIVIKGTLVTMILSLIRVIMDVVLVMVLMVHYGNWSQNVTKCHQNHQGFCISKIITMISTVIMVIRGHQGNHDHHGPDYDSS